MTPRRKFTMQLLALAVFGVALIWVSGSGVALQSSDANADELFNQLHARIGQMQEQMYADTIKIDAEEGVEGIKIAPPEENSRETMFKNMKLFSSMAYQIKNRYMEDIDAKDLIRAGIRGMLKDLDPFSVLMEEQSYDRLMESTHGKYEGLGMVIDSRGERIRVISPIEGTPAYRKGLQAGDIIWEINGEPTEDMNSQDATNLMRGPAGTSVVLKIKRQGIPDFLEYEIERAIIELKSVNYYGYFPGTNIGYIRLSRFAEETSNELREALISLQEGKKLDGLVFDLRSNGGGLLTQAVETANLFLDNERLIVYTRGRSPDTEKRYYSDQEPLLPSGKLVVLVDAGTASASEIVAGAIQDWDRGIILGEQTYGKGLVQQIFPAGGNHDIALRLTTAKYYIPSGRCIQRPELNKKQETANETDDDSIAASDTLHIEDREVFFTNGGRVVYGGGGIYPDVELDPQEWYPIEINLERQSMFFDFAVEYTSKHAEVSPDFETTDDVLSDFRQFIKEKDFDYKTSLEVTLEEMRDVIREEEKEELFSSSLDELEMLIENEKEMDFNRSRENIRKAIRREIITKLYGQSGLYEEVIIKTDPDVQKAIQLILNDQEYSRIITGQDEKAEVLR